MSSNLPAQAGQGPDGWAATLAKHKERTRVRILAAAADLLAARGASELAMTALARRAGVARATLYNYFPSAESVLQALVEAETAAFLDDLDHRLAPVPDALGQLRGTTAALIAWVARQTAQRPSRSRSRSGSGTHDIASIHRPLGALQRRVATVIVAARDAGALPPLTDPGLAAGFVVALVFGFRDRLGGADNGQVAGALHAFVLAGLGVQPPPAAKAGSGEARPGYEARVPGAGAVGVPELRGSGVATLGGW